jgi:phosphatidylglycerol:prolipoprotein diacylglycerol transferase
MYVVAMVIGLSVIVPYAEERGIDRKVVYDAFWPILIAGLIGGRLYYVVQSNLGWYLAHPGNILATWEGGMAVYGAIIAGLVAAFFVCRSKRIDFAKALDVAALFSIAQAIGRIGNIINGDIIGPPSSLPWAVEYTNPHNTFVPSHAVAYQPAAAYELLFSLALFGLLWLLRHRFRVPGTLFTVFICLYSVGQFGLFFIRSSPSVLLGLKQAQITAVVVVAVAVPCWYWWRSRYSETYRPPASVPLARSGS